MLATVLKNYFSSDAQYHALHIQNRHEIYAIQFKIEQILKNIHKIIQIFSTKMT